MTTVLSSTKGLSFNNLICFLFRGLRFSETCLSSGFDLSFIGGLQVTSSCQIPLITRSCSMVCFGRSRARYHPAAFGFLVLK